MSLRGLPSGVRVRTLAEVCADARVRRQKVVAGRVRWGSWSFDPKLFTIQHDDGYWWGLDRLQDSASVLDFIAQVAGKTARFTAADVGFLVRALDELIELQRTVCGCGRDRRFDPRKAVAREVGQ